MKIKLLIVLAVFNLKDFTVEGMWEPSQMANLKKDLKSRGEYILQPEIPSNQIIDENGDVREP